MANIAVTPTRDSRRRLVARDFALAILPVSVVALILIAGSIAAAMGWLESQASDGHLGVDATSPRASVGTGSLGKDGYLLEIPSGGNTAVATWLTVPAGLADRPLIRCDCVLKRAGDTLNILWRRADQPGKTFGATIEHELGETELVDLSRNPDWTGQIVGVAVALAGYPGDVVLIRGLDARKGAIGDRVALEIGRWSTFRKWDGQSINLAIIGARDRVVSPVVLIAVAIALGLLAFLRTRPPGRAAMLAMLTAVIIGWAGLDARWQLDLLAKHRATMEEFGSGPIAERWQRSPDADIYALAASVKRAFRNPAQRVFVFGDDPYSRGRAAYHLLPLSVHYDVSGKVPSAQFIRPGDLIFMTWSRYVRYDEQTKQLIWNDGVVKVQPLGFVHGNVVFRVIA